MIQCDFVAFQIRVDLFGRNQHVGAVLLIEECPAQDQMALVSKIMEYSGYIEIRQGPIHVDKADPRGYRFR